MSCDGFKYPEVVNPQIIHSKKIDFLAKTYFSINPVEADVRLV